MSIPKGYAAVLSGDNYIGGYLETDSEFFPSIASAVSAMRERRSANGWPCRTVILDFNENGLPFVGETYSTAYPGFGYNGEQLTLYTITETLGSDRDPYPDYILSFGPRGGVRVERA